MLNYGEEVMKNNEKIIDGVPGLSNSSWGDSIGRPVIRGMDRNRVQILNNGMQIKDVSNLSGDHAISLDSLSSEQIEVVRGPETIIYGGGAVGGVVNIIALSKKMRYKAMQMDCTHLILKGHLWLV